jgi:hypothetical protein
MHKLVRLLMVATTLAFVAGVVGNPTSAQAGGGGNCQAKLVGKSYDCSAKYSNLPPTSDCFEFISGGVSQDFDLVIDGDVEYGCSCDTTGSFNSPSFDSSPTAFECVSTASSFLLNAKIKGKKVNGQGTSEGGDSVIFTCQVRTSSCF